MNLSFFASSFRYTFRHFLYLCLIREEIEYFIVCKISHNTSICQLALFLITELCSRKMQDALSNSERRKVCYGERRVFIVIIIDSPSRFTTCDQIRSIFLFHSSNDIIISLATDKKKKNFIFCPRQTIKC